DVFRIILVLHSQVQAAELDDSLDIEQGAAEVLQTLRESAEVVLAIVAAGHEDGFGKFRIQIVFEVNSHGLLATGIWTQCANSDEDKRDDNDDDPENGSSNKDILLRISFCHKPFQ